MWIFVLLVGSLFVLVFFLIDIARERSQKDEKKYLALLSIYKDNGGKCYKALPTNASDEERVAWEKQEVINKRALELSGLEYLRAGSYVHFR